MDKGTITALKLAGYSVEETRRNINLEVNEVCWEWLLNNSDNGYEEESDYFFDTPNEAWDDALRHLQTGESQ